MSNSGAELAQNSIPIPTINNRGQFQLERAMKDSYALRTLATTNMGTVFAEV